MSDSVVLVHGIWMNGLDMSLLRYRMSRYGYRVHQYSYRSIGHSLAESAPKLKRFVEALSASRVHFIAHSLGGLLLRRFFYDYPDQPPGRVVTLGTPHQGSQVARSLSRHAIGRHVLGKSLREGLLGDLPEWRSPNQLGVIAGTVSAGVGRIITRLPRPNDGTVALCETPVQGMTDFKVLPVTHMALVLQSSVAKEINHFLQHGCFIPTDSA